MAADWPPRRHVGSSATHERVERIDHSFHIPRGGATCEMTAPEEPTNQEGLAGSARDVLPKCNRLELADVQMFPELLFAMALPLRRVDSPCLCLQQLLLLAWPACILKFEIEWCFEI